MLFLPASDLGHFAFYGRFIVFGFSHGNVGLVPWVQLGLVLALARLEHGKAGSSGLSQPSKLDGPVFDRHLLPPGNFFTLYLLA